MASFRLLPRIVIPALLWVGSVTAQAGDEPVSQSPRSLLSGAQGIDGGLPVSSSQTDFSRFWSPGLRNWAGGSFSMPFATEERRLDGDRSSYSRALSIHWQHRADTDRYTVTARRESANTTDLQPATASGLTASFAWQHLLNADTLFTSRLLMGDEENRTPQTGQWARRYYGMEFEGRYQLWPQHTPFATFSWQRSGYDALDPASGFNANGRWENRSQFSAGWRYQPLPNWDFRAEAKLRFSEDAIDPSDNDRSQLYFSTQYGFR